MYSENKKIGYMSLIVMVLIGGIIVPETQIKEVESEREIKGYWVKSFINRVIRVWDKRRKEWKLKTEQAIKWYKTKMKYRVQFNHLKWDTNQIVRTDILNRNSVMLYLDGKSKGVIDNCIQSTESKFGKGAGRTGVSLSYKILRFTRKAYKWFKGELTWRFGSKKAFSNYLFTGKYSKKRQARIVIAMMVMLALLVNPIFGFMVAGVTIYFDDDVGDDTWTGELAEPNVGETDGPKKTLEAWYNYVKSPGDNFFFQRGQKFVQTSWIGLFSDGEDGNPITIGAYGSGDRPIWDGDDYTYYNDCRAHYVVYEHIEFYHGQSSALMMQTSDAHNILVYDCFANDALSSGFHCSGGWNGDVTIRDCDVTKTGYGIYFGGNETYHGDNIVIEGCHVYDTWGGDQICIHEGTSGEYETYKYQTNGKHHIVRNNICDRNAYGNNPNTGLPTTQAGQSLDLTSGNDFSVYNNEFDSPIRGICYTGHTAYDIVFYKNYCHDWRNGGNPFRWGVANTTVWGNLIEESEVFDEALGMCLIDDDSEDTYPSTYLYKNTFVSSGYASSTVNTFITIHDINGRIGTTEIKYNIFTSRHATDMPINFIRIYGEMTYGDERLDIDYNVWGPGSFNSFGVNWTAWKEYGHDIHGVNADPLLVGRTTQDYHLQTDSPARGMGPGGYCPYPSMDGYNTQYNAGAYEYVAGEQFATSPNTVIVIITTNG